MDIVRYMQVHFGFELPSELWSNRVRRSDVKYATCRGRFDYGTKCPIHLSLTCV